MAPIDNRERLPALVHRRAHARRTKAWTSVVTEARPDDVTAWASAKRPIQLSAAEVGVPLETTPWSFWLVIRLGEAMLAAGVIGPAGASGRAASAVGGKLAMSSAAERSRREDERSSPLPKKGMAAAPRCHPGRIDR